MHNFVYHTGHSCSILALAYSLCLSVHTASTYSQDYSSRVARFGSTIASMVALDRAALYGHRTGNSTGDVQACLRGTVQGTAPLVPFGSQIELTSWYCSRIEKPDQHTPPASPWPVQVFCGARAAVCLCTHYGSQHRWCYSVRSVVYCGTPEMFQGTVTIERSRRRRFSETLRNT